MKLLLAAAIAATALTSTGCAQSMPSAAASSQDTAIAEVRDSVETAVEAAKSYGRKHLGHYLELNRAGLRAEGFTPTDGVELTIYIDHFDVCINAASSALPAGAEWSTATATSSAPEAVAGGACSENEALKQFSVGG